MYSSNFFSNNMSLIPKEAFYINWKNYYQDYHHHDYGSIEIDYIASGECTYIIGEKTFYLKKHDLLIFNGNIPHDYMVPKTCLNMSIICTPDNFSLPLYPLATLISTFKTLQDLFQNSETGVVIKEADSLFPLLKEIYMELTTQNNLVYLNILLSKALIDISVFYNKNQANSYVDQIIKYISYNYFLIENIEEIANAVSLNKVYLQRIFKSEVGTTVWNYLTQIRMQKAVYLLSDSKIPIGKINELVGINSRQNFNLLFKKTYGISPSDYRKKHI